MVSVQRSRKRRCKTTMARKKIGKQEALNNRLRTLRAELPKAMSKCLKNGITIAAECIVDKVKWRIIIELKNEEGGIIERIESDGGKNDKTYSKKEDYEIKIMELYVHYAKTLES
jgi:hypothetical protein